MSVRGVSGALLVLLAAGITACSGVSTPGPGNAEVKAAGFSSALSPLDVLRGGGAGSDESAEGFARALTVRPFEFPQDHGPHPQYRHEWWYLTGHLRARDGARFGFELTFFRMALAPPGTGAATLPAGEKAAASAAPESRWRTNQIYAAHFALTDVGRQQFHSAGRYAREALGLAGAQAAPFRVWVQDWSLAQQTGEGVWMLRAGDASYGLTLQLRALDAPVANGDHGLSVKSDAPGSASYYYSIPRLEVQGELRRGSHTLSVSGLAWLDREWGSGSLGPREQGWDWFALQFTDGSALMFYSLRDQHGAPDPYSAGTWLAADGTTRPLSSREVRIDVQSHWMSPRHTLYPSRWRVRVSGLGVDVELAPVLAGQELDAVPRYWEGDVNVTSRASGRALGEGYVELVGYD